MKCTCNICKTGGVCLDHHRETEAVNAELLAACKKLLYNAELMALTVGVDQAEKAIAKAEKK